MTQKMEPHVTEKWAQNLEIFEIKQLADKEALYKSMCRNAIREYRGWQSAQSDQTDMIELLYGSMEGDMHRNRMNDTIKMYWAIRKHFRVAYARYIKKTGCYPAASYQTNRS